jgi:SAM-dependent methyltransferase
VEAIGATGGNLYKHLIGALPRYPIPSLQLDAPPGSRFLDIGCHWGRWCVSAARRGFRVIGLDPYLPAVRAAKRVASALGVDASFVVGDARFLPFRTSSFDVVHSYSVLQHFAEDDVRSCVKATARVVRPGGSAHIQMAQRHGALNFVQQLRRGFRTPTAFEVRYWSGGDLRRVFSDAMGPTELTVDGFFSLNAQSADLDLLRPAHRVIVRVSNALRQLSGVVPPLVHVADSVYVRAINSSRRA